jgi:hypothetical protein
MKLLAEPSALAIAKVVGVTVRSECTIVSACAAWTTSPKTVCPFARSPAGVSRPKGRRGASHSQIDGNLILPLTMARTVDVHPSVVSLGLPIMVALFA